MFLCCPVVESVGGTTRIFRVALPDRTRHDPAADPQHCRTEFLGAEGDP